MQDHHDEEEIKHFLEQIDSHRHVKAKPKKKDKDKDKGKDKVGFAVIVRYVASNPDKCPVCRRIRSNQIKRRIHTILYS